MFAILCKEHSVLVPYCRKRNLYSENKALLDGFEVRINFERKLQARLKVDEWLHQPEQHSMFAILCAKSYLCRCLVVVKETCTVT